MPVNRDPNISVIFEWETGIKKDNKVHTVRLEIPPNQISLRMSKNVQKTVTTKGWVLNHGIDNLVTITASGQAYHPRIEQHAREEGFKPEIGISGLEYLQAAYISSGRLSSNPELVTTVSSDLFKQTLTQEQVTSKEGLLHTISRRVSMLNKIRNRLVANSFQFANSTTSGTNIIPVSNNQDQVSLPEFNESNRTTQKDIDEIKTTISADVYGLELTEDEKNEVYNLINVLRLENTESVALSFNELANRQQKLVPVKEKLDYMLNRAKNQNTVLAIPRVDPSVGTLIQRDPYAILKAGSAQSINNKVKQQDISGTTLKTKIQETVNQPQADDWVITVYMYWQDMVFLGHFESFELNQSAQILGLWNWSFTYVVHEGWLLKNNNIVPFTRAFDPHVTNIESPGARPDEYRNVNRPMERLILKEGSGSRPAAFNQDVEIV